MSSNNLYLTIGQKLRAKRHMKHITLTEMAQKINKSVATISKYEKGELSIGVDVLVDMCTILNIDIASLLPVTCSEENLNTTSRSQKFFSDRLYIYWFNGEKHKIQRAVLECQSLSSSPTLYFDIADINNYYEANYVYKGSIVFDDASTFFSFTYTEPPFDKLTFRLPTMKHNHSVRIGLLSTISHFYQSIAMKIVASETPLPENEELMLMLRISSEEMKDIKRTNYFIV
jgi:transcriptional regulator with XRE-family HTH domain